MPLALLHASSYVNVLPNWKFPIFLFLFGHLAIAWHFGKFCTVGPALCIKLCLMYGQMGNFQYFSFCLAHWLLKPWHFGKFHHWPCFVHQVMSHVWSNGKFLIFLFLFGTWAVKAMAFWEILLSSHQNLPFLKCVK